MDLVSDQIVQLNAEFMSVEEISHVQVGTVSLALSGAPILCGAWEISI